MGLTAKTAKDAYFLSRFEKSILPLMFLVVAVAIAPILSGYTKLAKKLAPKIMFILTTSIFCFSFILSQSLISGWVVPVIYVWVEIVVAIALIQFWAFAAESFQPQQAKGFWYHRRRRIVCCNVNWHEFKTVCKCVWNR